jgi:thioredoxin 1
MAAFKDIINSDTPVLVDFFAEWCGPCKMMPPVLKDVKSTLGDQVKVLKIDVDKNKKVATDYQIQGVPTLILFKAGKIVWRKSGVIPATELVAQVKAIP